jgi:hypothetical protein
MSFDIGSCFIKSGMLHSSFKSRPESRSKEAKSSVVEDISLTGLSGSDLIVGDDGEDLKSLVESAGLRGVGVIGVSAVDRDLRSSKLDA